MRVIGHSGCYANNSNHGGNLKMNRLLRKSALVSVLTAGLVLLLSACGGGGSSSGGGGTAIGAGATSIVRGNVTGTGNAQAMFIQQMPGSGVERIVKLIADGVISSAYAGTAGVIVCVIVDGSNPLAYCDTTDSNGDFAIDLSAVAAGTYPITFAYNGVTYTSEITVIDDAIVDATVEIDEVEGEVSIEGIDIILLDDGVSDDDGDAGNVVKITICHKPGTPAEKTKQVPEPAVPGHMGHGDTEGACPGGTVADSGDEPIDSDG